MSEKIQIGILTFHRSINYGAFMQCYALCNRIKRDFPQADVEVIDYVSKMVYDRYKPSVLSYIIGPKGKRNSLKESAKRMAKSILFPKQIRSQKERYNAFQSVMNVLPLSKEKLISDDVKLFYETYRGKYDVVIIGSDAVWEFLNYPFPNVYFMHDKIANHIISYAASCDRMHINTINNAQREYIKEGLLNFKYLGVRDVSTESFVGNICSAARLFHNCDPTALLDLNSFSEHKELAREKLITYGIDLRKPMIGIMGGRLICKFAKEIFGKTHQIISLYDYNPDADFSVTNLTPLEWANVFSFFDLTFTRYFHGFWLSVINGVSPIVIDDWFMIDDKHDSKLLDLAKRLDLLDHYFRLADLSNKKEEITALARRLVNADESDLLFKKVSQEANTYQSFKTSLNSILDNYKK